MALPPDIEAERLKLELRLRILEARDKAKASFINFARYVWPEAIVSAHHQKMADAFDRIVSGKLKRLIINMPPRFTKSEFASYLLPAFAMGHEPRSKIIQATHNGELAVRFGRKVRNLMDQDSYKELFPEVSLKADSKAAGRWDTNGGGEYYACLRHHVLVHTLRGKVPAGQVVVGDVLLNAGDTVAVRRVYRTHHRETYSVLGVDCSALHPVWTMNRGWVYAKDIASADVLAVESIWDKMKALRRKTYGLMEHAYVPTLVQHQVSMHKSTEREVGLLRWTWNCVVRTLAGVRAFLERHGATAFQAAHGGTYRQRWALQSGELSVGGSCSAGKQQEKQCTDSWQDFGRARQGVGGDAGNDPVSDSLGPRSFSDEQASQERLRAYGNPKGLGWLRHQATRIIARSGSAVRKQTSSAQGYLARIKWAAERLQGLLLGVRLAGEICVTRHMDQEPFVNFLTDGDHSFFAQGVLTHNCGVGGAMTGRGADLLIIDDPHSEQDALSELSLDNAWEWYTSGPRSRLQPGGSVVVVMARWGMKDLTARLIKAQAEPKSDQWEVIEFPAILNERTEHEKSLWPSYWSLDELQKVRATLSVQKWQAMYQQQPTNDEGAILKREWWRIWENDYTPQVDYVIQSYDTAYSKKETADFSAITTWGVFRPSADDGPAIILLDVKKGRWDFPELKRVAKMQYDYWRPDNVLIEGKATGITLQQELRRVGIPVTMYSPGGRRAGQDKIARANSVAPVFEAGMVWAPETKWAEELIEECAAFPKGDSDDLVDSTVQAIMRFRAGNFVALDDDEADDPVTQLEFEYY